MGPAGRVGSRLTDLLMTLKTQQAATILSLVCGSSGWFGSRHNLAPSNHLQLLLRVTIIFSPASEFCSYSRSYHEFRPNKTVEVFCSENAGLLTFGVLALPQSVSFSHAVYWVCTRTLFVSGLSIKSCIRALRYVGRSPPDLELKHGESSVSLVSVRHSPSCCLAITV